MMVQEPRPGRTGAGRPEPSRLRRILTGIATTETERDAEDLQSTAADAGATPVCDCGNRKVVTVAGTLQTVSISPRGGVQSLEAELWDGTATVTLVWLGRRRIIGIKPGAKVVVTGRIGQVDGLRVMFNPRYELRPAHQSAHG